MSPAATRTITYDEWKAEGERRFGPDMMTWRFVCPGCGNEQSVEDFKPFKDHGATTSSAYAQCLGRFLPKAQTRSWMNDKPRAGVRCDYAAFGLLCICTTQVRPPGDGPKSIAVFEFAEPVASPPAPAASDPHVPDTGKLSTRESPSSFSAIAKAEGRS